MAKLKKRLHQKDKINFKIYEVATWLTNNGNTHIAQYLTKKQPDNETWSIDRIYQGKYFGQYSWSIDRIYQDIYIQELCRKKVGRLVPDLFLLFNKA